MHYFRPPSLWSLVRAVTGSEYTPKYASPFKLFQTGPLGRDLSIMFETLCWALR